MTLFLCKQVPDISVIVLCDGCWLSTTVTDACWNCVKIFAAKAKLANVWLSASLARGCTISDDLTAMFTAPKSSSRHGSCQQWGADNISYFIDLCRPSSLRNPLLFFSPLCPYHTFSQILKQEKPSALITLKECSCIKYWAPETLFFNINSKKSPLISSHPLFRNAFFFPSMSISCIIGQLPSLTVKIIL